jgi:hypothetical protein
VSTDANRVELSLPANAEMLFMARMTAAAVATCVDLNYEQVEDLRLAIDELGISLLSHGDPSGRIMLLFEWSADGTVDVTGTFVPQNGATNNGNAPDDAQPPHARELSQRILDALVDEHGSDCIGGLHRAWLRLHRHGLAPSV